MTGAQIALSVHFFGLMLWIGGAATAAWMAASIVSSGASSSENGKALSTVRSALLAIVAPGILLATLGALAMLIPGWSAYSHTHWLHAKIAIGLALGALHGVLVGRVRRASKGVPTSAGMFVGLAVANVALGLIAVVLAVARPGE